MKEKKCRRTFAPAMSLSLLCVTHLQLQVVLTWVVTGGGWCWHVVSGGGGGLASLVVVVVGVAMLLS